MDTRTSRRTGGSYAGTTFYADRGPSVDDMPWCTSYADVEHVFRSKDWVQGGGGARDSYEFIGDGLPGQKQGSEIDGYCVRRRRAHVYCDGHDYRRCLGAREDSAEQAGLMVACLLELYQRGMRPDSENVPEKSGVNMRDEYASYWVVFDT